MMLLWLDTSQLDFLIKKQKQELESSSKQNKQTKIIKRIDGFGYPEWSNDVDRSSFFFFPVGQTPTVDGALPVRKKN